MKDIFFFNTLTRQRELFKPIKEGHVGIYSCGPTVYDFAHIGNFRAYVFEDILRRTLKYFGYKVFQVMNLTDVDDKTIRNCRAAGISLEDYTRRFKDAFFEDIAKLRIERAEVYPAATDHIKEMIELVGVLMKKGVAYKADDGSVYFSIEAFSDYGRLARIDKENQRSGARIRTDEYDKEDVSDFALWKAYDEDDGDVFWESPWGRGRPGWHLECSAMSMKYLGKTFDIHTGGVDNIFPHHEDEIAQSQAANGVKFVNYWLHCEHLLVDGRKMSKSLGNFYTLRDLESKGFNDRQIRMILAGTHYRKKLNFTLELCEKAGKALEGFDAFFGRLGYVASNAVQGDDASKCVSSAKDGFASAMASDLNVAEAIAHVHGLVKEANRLLDSGTLGSKGSCAVLDAFRDFDRILAFFDVDHALSRKIPDEVMKLVEDRQSARIAKDFAKADVIRESLNALGWVVEDTPHGPRVFCR